MEGIQALIDAAVDNEEARELLLYEDNASGDPVDVNAGFKVMPLDASIFGRKRVRAQLRKRLQKKLNGDTFGADSPRAFPDMIQFDQKSHDDLNDSLDQDISLAPEDRRKTLMLDTGVIEIEKLDETVKKRNTQQIDVLKLRGLKN